jgi:hypothetical protein
MAMNAAMLERAFCWTGLLFALSFVALVTIGI